ncbi:unnamed protein product [[Candida] boidinii]|nr:unnamed protein product [[Candida] boidinii]
MASGNSNTSSGSNTRFPNNTMNPPSTSSSPSPSSSSSPPPPPPPSTTPSNLHRRSSSKGAWNTNRRNNNNGNGNGNGNGNEHSNESSSPSSPHSSFDPVVRHMDDRLLFGLINSVGCTATVTVASGSIFKGLLYTTSELTNFGFSIVLKYPEVLKLSDSDFKNDNFDSISLNESLIIYDKDLMLLKIDDVDLSPSTATTSPKKSTPSSNNNSNPKLGFRTDTDISAISGIREHELKKWVPDENDSSLSNMGGLEDDQDFETFGSLSNNNNSNINNNRNNAGGSWDQFEVNERKFGIQSSYDEELYTTKLDTNAPDFQQRLAEAERIAKEIESQAYNGDIHVAEERGIIIDDSGVDEEDKYSGVLRDDPQSSTSSSVPQRLSTNTATNNNNKNGGALLMGLLKANAKPSVQKEFKPATPGAYVPPSQRAAKFHGDPAIINSSAVPSLASSSGIPQKPSTNDSSSSSIANTATSPSAPSTALSTSSSIPGKPASIPKKPEPSPTSNNNSSSSIPTKPKSSNGANTSISSEARKLNLQSEINSFKEFSANFKVPQKFPTDLLPILSKDKAKQEEIMKRKEAEVSPSIPSNTPTPTPTPTATPRQITSSSSNVQPNSIENVTVKSPQKSDSPSLKNNLPVKKKMDAKNAPVFKMNPNAASFSPSVKSSPLPQFTNLSYTPPDQQQQQQQQQQRNRKFVTNFFAPGHTPKDPSVTKNNSNPINENFNILSSARLEFESKVKELAGSENFTTIPIEKPFTATPTWPNTREESYNSFYSPNPEFVQPPMRKMYLPPSNLTSPMMGNTPIQHHPQLASPSMPQQFIPQKMAMGQNPMMFDDRHHHQQQQQQQLHHQNQQQQHHHNQHHQQHHHPNSGLPGFANTGPLPPVMIPTFQPQFFPMGYPAPNMGTPMPNVLPPAGFPYEVVPNMQPNNNQMRGNHRGSRGHYKF